MDIQDIFCFERHLEQGFIALLQGLAPNIYGSRDTRTAASPRMTVKAVVGGIADRHVHPFPSGKFAYDCYLGNLSVEIVTNRTTANIPPTQQPGEHQALTGRARAALEFYRIVDTWAAVQQTVIITDIYADGTEDSFQDNDLDYTTLSFNLVFNVNPAAWPENL